jgi:hypothetical protein
VLLAMFLANDIEGNSAELQQDSAWRLSVPTHTLVDGELVLNGSFRNPGWRRLLYGAVHYSRVFELINEVRRTIRAWSWQSSALSDIEVGLSADIYKPSESPAWQEAWRVTKALLAEMNDLVRGLEGRFVVTTIPRAIEIDPTRERREQFEAQIGVDDLFFPDEQIARMGSAAGFPVYPLTRELQAIAEQRKIYLHGFENTQLGFGHLNEQGHAVVADLLTTKLCNPADLGLDDQQIARSR